MVSIPISRICFNEDTEAIYLVPLSHTISHVSYLVHLSSMQGPRKVLQLSFQNNVFLYDTNNSVVVFSRK